MKYLQFRCWTSGFGHQFLNASSRARCAHSDADESAARADRVAEAGGPLVVVRPLRSASAISAAAIAAACTSPSDGATASSDGSLRSSH